MSTEPASSAPQLAEHLSALVEQRLAKLTGSLGAAHRVRSVEAVHELRVASRRLRAFGVIFQGVLGDKRSRRLDKALRRVTRAVGALRDQDVLRELLEARAEATSNELERASLEHLLEHLDEGRAAVISKAERRLHELDTNTLCRRIRRAARTVAAALPTAAEHREYVRTLLERLIADAAEQVPAEDPLASEGAEQPERLHRLRIDCKKLRYALELFEPVLGSNFQLLYDRATTLQNGLGAYHDLATLDQVLAERGAQLERKGRQALRAGVQCARAGFTQQRRAALERFRADGFDAHWWRAALNEALAPR